MGAITRNLKQNVTYWTAVSNGYGGYTYGSPQALRGRWEDKQELFRTLIGDEEVSNAMVWLAADVQEGGYLYLGTSVAADPSVVAGARQIRKFTKIPDLRAVEYERKAVL